LDNQKLDLAAFTLSGNLLIELTNKGVISKEEAMECLSRTKIAIKHNLDDVDLDVHLENLAASIEAAI